MTYTKSRDLVAAGLLAAIVIYVVVFFGYGSLPPLPAPAGATLLVIAAIDGILALTLGPRVQRRPGREPLEPETATRAVALAKASSLAGAIMAGAWLGVLAYVLPLYSSLEAARSDTVAAIVGLISAAALIGTGLWLEYALRNPDEPEEDDEQRPMG